MKSPVVPRSVVRQTNQRPGRQGAAAVEFAVVLPLFLLLLAGIIEFGQVFRIQHALSNACRRGARSAIVEGATASVLKQKVKQQCNRSFGVSEADVSVEISVNGDPNFDLLQAVQGDEISFTVTVPFAKAGTGFYLAMFSNTDLSSTCILEHE